MKNKRFFIIFVLILLLGGAGFADTLTLKSGQVIEADDIWEADGFIRYKKFDSVVSLPLSQVQSIERSKTKPDARRTVDNPEEKFGKDEKSVVLDSEIDEMIGRDLSEAPESPGNMESGGEFVDESGNESVDEFGKRQEKGWFEGFLFGNPDRSGMTIRDFIYKIEQIPAVILFLLFITPPLAAWVLPMVLKEGRGERFPWNLLYSALVYFVAVPGLLAGVLTAYSIFMIGQNLLYVNVFVYFMPIISMVVTLAIIGRTVSWTNLPGVDRLYALMIIIAVSFGATLAIQKTRIFIFFGGSVTTLIYIAIFCFVLIKLSMWMLFRKKKKKYRISGYDSDIYAR